MEIDSDNVAEVEKYAFLLGSAIKNEDSEQFFSIYDSIIPKDLPDNQLEDIKEKAREVADLPDGEFNDLVLEARHFSLAPAGTTMSCPRDSTSTRWTQPAKDEVVEEDDGIGSVGSYPRYGSVLSGLPDEPTYYPAAKTRTESETKRFDTDSGVCNSSKASFGSLSDHEGSEEEGRCGVSFNYYPPQIKIRSGCGLNLDYDEAHEVKSDHSSQDVNSPRSDISEGIEMTTFQSRTPLDDDDDEFNFRRETVQYQDDFNTSGESEDENSYGRKYYNMGYRPLASYTPSFSAYPNSDVDKGINFTSLKQGSSTYSRYSAYQPSSSDRVKIEKTSYKKDPPFGRGPEQLRNVGSSIGSLISGVTSDEVKNMPEGRKLAPLTAQEDSKKRKKKKRNSKDDASATTDENGNPIAETRGLTSATYKQMRESPSLGGGTVANHCDSGYGTFPDTGPRPYTSSNHRDAENDAAAKVRRRKKKTEDKKTAEDIENYQGDKSIDELLNFIGGQNESNKKTKKNSSPVNEDISAKTQKSKKSKDKKQKSPTASSSVEEADSKEVVTAKPGSVSKPGSKENMGNSSAKTDSVDIPTVENGDIDGLIPHKNDKLSKALLKDNDCVEKSAIHVNNDKLVKGGVICRESVKEKEPSSTNNKRDIVSITSSVDNIKKKVDKSGKALKADKSEMPVSKSEEVLRLDSLSNNVTVKQKNTKNKKNKPSSPTVKLENEIPVLDTNQDSVLLSFSNEALGTDFQDTFIFTDLDVPLVPKEDEFQLVGKKKKKATKEVEKPQNHFVNNYTKPTRRDHEKRPVLSHVPNKAIIAQSPPGEIDTHVRDLSPSAFPALRQEGRRNSTGDVPIPCVLKSQDDSDLESVKSLPATQGSQTVEGILSPRLSYAKMAAGSKVLDSSSSSEKGSSVDSRDGDYDHKKALWKGSPTERRHSIGSSPEVVNKLTGSPSAVTAAVSGKAGSQEHIVVDVASKPVPQSVQVLTPDTGVVVSDVKTYEEDNRVLSPDYSPSENLKTNNVSPVVSVQPTVSPAKTVDNNVNIVINSQPAVVSKQSPVNVNSDTEMNSTSVINRNSSVAISNVQAQETCRCKSSTSSNNGRKLKSVIFLDKRVEESPGNLGISFGFEEKDDVTKPDKTESVEFDINNDQSDQGTNTSDCNVDNSQTINFLNSVDLNLEPNNVLVNEAEKSSSSSSVISNSSSSSEIAKSSSSNNTDTSGPTKTVPEQIVRMNGIVAPQGPSSKLSNEVQEVKADISTIAGSDKTVDSQHTIPEPRLNEVLVYFGEGVVTLKKDIVVRSLNNGPTSYCGLLKFIEETNLRSNFNVNEAAAFLTREWDRTIQLQDREPDSVTVHQD